MDEKQEIVTAEPAEDVEPWTRGDRMQRWAALLDSRATWLRVARMLAAPLLAAAAVGMHFALNVPDDEVRKTLEAQKKAPANRKPKRPKSAPSTLERRSDAELERLFEHFSRIEFDQEPVVAIWARRHQALVNKAVVLARKHSFAGAPEEPRIVVTATRCRTIRCRFVLRSPYPHEIELLDAALQELRLGDGPLWRDYVAQRIDPPAGSPPTESYLQVTVAFTVDEPDGSTISIDDGGHDDETASETDAATD